MRAIVLAVVSLSAVVTEIVTLTNDAPHVPMRRDGEKAAANHGRAPDRPHVRRPSRHVLSGSPRSSVRAESTLHG